MKTRKLFMLPLVTLLASCGGTTPPSQGDSTFKTIGKQLIDKGVEIMKEINRSMITPDASTPEGKNRVAMAYLNPGNFFYMISGMVDTVNALGVDASKQIISFGFTYSQWEQQMDTKLDIMYSLNEDTNTLYFAGKQAQKVGSSDWDYGYCVVEAKYDVSSKGLVSFTLMNTEYAAQTAPYYYEFANEELKVLDNSVVDEEYNDVQALFNGFKEDFNSKEAAAYVVAKGQTNKPFVDAYEATQRYVDGLMGGDSGFVVIDY